MNKIARPLSAKPTRAMGARVVEDGGEFSVFSRHGEAIFVCLFDPVDGREVERWRLAGREHDIHHGFVPGATAGTRYGLRADGPDDPARGHRFDPSKLLVDPLATRVDRPFMWRPELAAPRAREIDTAALVPRAIIEAPALNATTFGGEARPGFIYEVSVKAFTKLHPDVPAPLRGSLQGLADPRVIERLAKRGVSHVELMPVTAFMSERHLVDLGLENAWGYNPAVFTALDPRLAPGGLDDLTAVVEALRAAGIAVLLDVVFNHTAESDIFGPTINLRGLDNAVYYRHDNADPVQLINDTGCGNTLACDRAPVVDLIVDSLRTFVERCGVEGFRFDLAATLARGEGGFPEPHPLLVAIANDPALNGRAMIAEPWDIGPGGYRLGAFPSNWLEWNDRFRDGVRRFWRGDRGAMGDFATRLAGSEDIFGSTRAGPSASVNFIAAHDGFTLRDVLSFNRKHNEPNGENNRDGTDDNLSWNHGVEGNTDDPEVNEARARDARAMLACVFLARGTPMVTAGDEFGRGQRGNNNAYAQDNETTWVDWDKADRSLAAFVAALARLREALPQINEDRFLTGKALPAADWPDVTWLNGRGEPMSEGDWSSGDTLCMALCARSRERVMLIFNRLGAAIETALPTTTPGGSWIVLLDSAAAVADAECKAPAIKSSILTVPARCVMALRELSPAP
jgi:glycogen operon protein